MDFSIHISISNYVGCLLFISLIHYQNNPLMYSYTTERPRSNTKAGKQRKKPLASRVAKAAEMCASVHSISMGYPFIHV